MIETKAKPEVSRAANSNGNGAIKCAVTVILTCLAAVALSSSASAANDVPIGLNLVWSFAHQGIARFCYDKTPAVIYPKYDVARKMTSILKRELDGEEHVVGEFPGSPDTRSLSCSQDGQTIVALGTIVEKQWQASLFLSKGTRTSLYLFSGAWLFSNVGLYSLLSPDGKSITLPEMPNLVDGPDFLKEMRVFPHGVENIFFMNDYAYQDGGNSVYKFEYVHGEWKKQEEIKRPPRFDLSEVARCGDRDVATWIGVDSSRFGVLGDSPLSKQDWLERIGVRKLFRKYSNPISITGSYGACAFPLRSRGSRLGPAQGLARFDANGLQLFSFPEPEVGLGGDEVSFSKDGCYALITAVPGTRLLAVQSPRCR